MNRSFGQMIFVLMLAAAAGIANACPMCKDSIPATDAQNFQAMPAAYNWSVYFFLMGLFSVMGFLGFNIIRAIRTTDRRH